MRSMIRMASVSFATHEVRVSPQERGASYAGTVRGYSANSLACHPITRVVSEQQRALGTTARQYIADLRRAIRDDAAHLVVYARRGGMVAAIVAAAARILPTDRPGSKPAPQMIVIYSADRGTIIPGYQFSTPGVAGIPPEARWLK